MMLKYLAYVCIIVGCGFVGIIMTSDIDARIKQLSDFDKLLKNLQFNIEFLRLPIKDAIMRASELHDGIIKKILDNMTALMLNKAEITPGKAWEASINNYRDKLSLNKQDIDALSDLAYGIGKGDTQNTTECIRLASAKLNLNLEEARTEREKNGKMYKGIGFLVGIFIVIVLL